MTDADKKLTEIAAMLNEGDYSEAMKAFREMHGMVNRFVCVPHGHVSDKAKACRCSVCGGEINVRVVVEVPDKGCIADPWSKSFEHDSDRSNTIWGNRM